MWDPESEYLRSAYHDVAKRPLVNVCLRTAQATLVGKVTKFLPGASKASSPHVVAMQTKAATVNSHRRSAQKG